MIRKLIGTTAEGGGRREAVEYGRPLILNLKSQI
jgi:hypothetical protein